MIQCEPVEVEVAMYNRTDLAKMFGVSYTTIQGVLKGLDKPWCSSRRQGRRTLYLYGEDVIEYLEKLGYVRSDDEEKG